jgi:uncharacterized protein YbjT (DUF2867 family)
MRVLVLGAGGFIGGRVVAGLLGRGHAVTCAGRDPDALRRRFPPCRAVWADLLADDTRTWMPCLVGTDAVVNAAGALRGDLEGVHHRGTVALFEACAAAGVPRLVQLSALGAGAQLRSRFLATKDAADAHLLRLARQESGRGWCVLRPSLVIGRGGGSTALFCALAAAPVPLRLGPGTWRVQPLHVADLARAVAELVEAPSVPPRLDLVGPEAMTTDALTAALRAWLGLPRRPPLPLPQATLWVAARIGDLLPGASLTSESLRMLAAGNTADPAPMVAALGWAPRRLADALAAEPAVAADLWLARLLPLGGILLGALVVVWVGSGIASFRLAPGQADTLLSGLGLTGRSALAVTWAGAALDIVLGLALLRAGWRRTVLVAQLAVMVAYTVLATVALPALWTDPFGPLLKNLAVLAATLALLAVQG